MTRSARAPWYSAAFAAAVTAALWWASAAGGASSGGSAAFATLRFPRGTDDRAVVAALRQGGVDRIVSESSQWVLINDFGDWERVPLDLFRDRLERFDPRDDGYADRLRPLFLDETHRYVYLPLGPWGERRFSRTVSRALGSFSYDYFPSGGGRSSLLPFVLAVLAFSAAMLVSGWTVPPASFLAVAALAGSGTGGIVAAGILCAAAVPLSRGFSEFFRADAKPDGGYSPWLLDSFAPGIALSAASVAAAAAVGTPILVAVLAALDLALLSAASAAVSAALSRKRGHRKFLPVALLRRGRTELAGYSLLLAPFAAAAAVFFFVGLFAGPSFPVAAALPPNVPLAAFEAPDYQAHLELQRGFMTSRVLDGKPGGTYASFAAGPDGMAGVAERPQSAALPKSELPPAERLLAEAGRGNAPRAASAFGFRTVAALLLAVAASVPGALKLGAGNRPARLSAAVAEKRIAA